MLSLEYRGDSNKYTQYIIFNTKFTLNYSKFATTGSRNEFESAVVSEPLVFEPLEFHCVMQCTNWKQVLSLHG